MSTKVKATENRLRTEFKIDVDHLLVRAKNGELDYDRDDIPVKDDAESRLRSLGLKPRGRRVEYFFLKCFQIASAKHPEWSDEDCWNYAMTKVAEKLDVPAKAREQFEKLTPSCTAPSREGVHGLIELSAVLRTKYFQRLEEILTAPRGGRGSRPTDRLNTSILFHGALEKTLPEINNGLDAFHSQAHHRDYAYNYPVSPKSPADRSGVAKALHRILKHNSPVATLSLNIEAIKELVEEFPKGRIGRYCSIDATNVEAFALQHQGYSHAERDFLMRGNGADFTMHASDGKLKKWRGYQLLVISCQKSTLPLVWMTVKDPAPEHIDWLLNILFTLWPNCPMKYLTGDREFDTNPIAELLYCKWGVDHVTVSDMEGTSKEREKYHKGVPVCCKGEIHPKTGLVHDGFMEVRGRENFCFAEERLDPKQQSREAKPRGVWVDYTNERIRWECPVCIEPHQVKLAYDIDKPELCRSAYFNYLPRAGSSEHAALRHAIAARRNTSESIFANLKRRYMAGGGCLKPQWIKTQQETDWVLGITLLGITVQRLVHHRGDYDRELKYAVENGLIKKAAQKRVLRGRKIEIDWEKAEASLAKFDALNG